MNRFILHKILKRIGNCTYGFHHTKNKHKAKTDSEHLTHFDDCVSVHNSPPSNINVYTTYYLSTFKLRN